MEIKNWLKQNWLEIIMVLFLLSLGIALFYWFEWRPSQIRIKCWEETLVRAKTVHSSVSETQGLLKLCLISKGLSN